MLHIPERLRRLAQVAGLVLLIPPLLAATPSRSPSLSSFTVRLADLRPGYQSVPNWGTMDDPLAATFHVDVAPYDDLGAQSSYSSIYCLQCGGNALRVVDSSISRYATVAQAQAAYLLNVSAVSRWRLQWVSKGSGKKVVYHSDQWRPMKSFLIGQQSSCWEARTHDAIWTNTVSLAIWQQGPYVAAVRILSRPVFNPMQVSSLAGLMARRIALTGYR